MGSRINRRGLMAGLTRLCIALFLMAVPLAPPATAASDPQDVARGFYGVLLGNMKDGRILGEALNRFRGNWWQEEGFRE